MSDTQVEEYPKRGNSPLKERNDEGGWGYDSRPSEDFNDRGRSVTEEVPNPGNNLYIRGLARGVRTQDIEQLFSKFGTIQTCNVLMDPQTNENRGFAFVTMESGEAAGQALESLNNSELMGKTITVELARRGRARTPTPGKYFGPKAEVRRRFDDRRDFRRRDDRYHDRRDRYDDRRDRYDDRRDRHDDRRDRYDDRRDRYDDRRDRYDDKREDRRERYDDRRREDSGRYERRHDDRDSRSDNRR